MKFVLDSAPLGLLTYPNRTIESAACADWVASLLAAKHEVVVAEIIVYELRRELLRMKKRKSLRVLETLIQDLSFFRLESIALDKAAEFWAASRQCGKPTASEKSLDIDVILAAQAWHLARDGSFVLIATTNQKHLSQFVPAQHWKDIHP